MSEQKQQTGDGQDNYGQAAKQTANALKQVGKNTAQTAAKKGAEATVNAATATVKAGAQAGKAAANIAAGTAAGGPWGAVISAAWSMRHTLFKVLICICLVIVFLVITIVSLPAILFDSMFGLPEDYSGSSLTHARGRAHRRDGYNATAYGYRGAHGYRRRIAVLLYTAYFQICNATEKVAFQTDRRRA